MAEQRYPLPSGAVLVWSREESSHVPPDNNLRLYDAGGAVVWTMRDALGYDDTCVSLAVHERGFRFLTFNCLWITVSLETLQVLERRVVK